MIVSLISMMPHLYNFVHFRSSGKLLFGEKKAKLQLKYNTLEKGKNRKDDNKKCILKYIALHIKKKLWK